MRILAIVKALVMLIVAVLSIVFVLGLSSPETRWSGPSLGVLGFAGLFIVLCVRFLIAAFRKGADADTPPGKEIV